MTVVKCAELTGLHINTVYRWLRRLRKKHGDGLTVINRGVMQITPRGMEVLLDSVKIALTPEPQIFNSDKQGFNSDKQGITDELERLRTQNDTLLNELITERTHARQLAERVAELAHNNQVLQGMLHSNPVLLSETPKRGIFSRIFGRKETNNGD
jgi:hypothetical protein